LQFRIRGSRRESAVAQLWSLGIMDAPPQFPSDENGDVFRRMVSNDDDLSKPRIIDFCHIFPERKQALAFAEEIDDRELEVCISYYEPRDMWQATVKRYMIPTHQTVTEFELSLAAKAESLGGEPDGWGCMTVKKKETT
jgi:hypothetical protein